MIMSFRKFNSSQHSIKIKEIIFKEINRTEIYDKIVSIFIYKEACNYLYYYL